MTPPDDEESHPVDDQVPLDALKAALPEYARDIGLNLESVLGASPLSEQQVWGTALACAVATRDSGVLAAIAVEARARLTDAAFTAAKAAASIMAMNNVYYRAKHLIGDPAYAALPARLRMRVVARPGVAKVDFELWALAVSSVFGCGVCLESHEKKLRGAGVPRETVHEALRIAAVVHAAAVTLAAERALDTSPPNG